MTSSAQQRRIGSGRRPFVVLLCLLVLSLPARGVAQKGEDAASQKSILVDQVVAIVNGDLILESDVDEERRLAAFQPFESAQPFSRNRTIERLINRTLILQQQRLQPQPPVSDSEIEKQFAVLRTEIPLCRQYDCKTEAGWERFVAAQGFTMQELLDRWRERMQVLRFIEMRFRMGVQITPEQIQSYYRKTLLPEYASRSITPPKLKTISDRIREILLQQQVNSLLQDWLQSLKAQGSVLIEPPGEKEP